MRTSYCLALGIRNRLLRSSFPIALSVVGLALTSGTHAGPHRHGVSELLMALDGNNLTLELTAPGKDIAGFENAPSTREQKEFYAKIVAVLKSAGMMFSLSEEAACRIGNVRVLKQLSNEHESAHADDERDEIEENKTHNDEDEHGEFRIRYSYTCDNPHKLTMIEVIAFQRFAAMQAIELTFIGPKGQAVRRLTRQKPATML